MVSLPMLYPTARVAEIIQINQDVQQAMLLQCEHVGPFRPMLRRKLMSASGVLRKSGNDTVITLARS